MHNYKQLEVWKKAVDLAVRVYAITKNFPSEGKFGITSQMRRCVVSISSNIAEGAGRNSDNEFRQFLHIAFGSCCGRCNAGFEKFNQRMYIVSTSPESSPQGEDFNLIS